MVNIRQGYGDRSIALGQLTASAQAIMNSNGEAFLHTQDLPDNGVDITNSEKASDGTIKVVTNWHYSGMAYPITKTFTLIQENNQWKIDKVQ
jgi:hypothetical protein